MIPFRHTDERVWFAIRDLHRRRIDPHDGWTVHLDPVLLLEADDVRLRAASGSMFSPQLFGLPVVPDGRLRRGEIVLRCEVPA